MAFCVAFVY